MMINNDNNNDFKICYVFDNFSMSKILHNAYILLELFIWI